MKISGAVVGQRSQNNSQMSKTNPNASYTRNGMDRMGNSEWEMLTMLSQQQQQLKTAQQYMVASGGANYEHLRKMQATNGFSVDESFASHDAYVKQPLPGKATAVSNRTAALSNCAAQNHINSYASSSGSAPTTKQINVDSKKPVLATQYVR